MTDDKENKKERADKYEEKVKFDGTFEDMVQMSFGGKKSSISSIYESKYNKGSIDIKYYRIATEYDSPPSYYIQFKPTKIEWKYFDKEERDEEIKALRELKRKFKKATK